MSALVRKEIRLLLPAWIAALAAATVPVWSGQFFETLWAPCFALGICYLSLAPFGQEVICGTFGLLLSQPENRRRFWRVKAGLLALAVVSAWALSVWCCGFACRHLGLWQVRQELEFYEDMAAVTGLLALLAFSGGLWTTLLLRDVTTAFFATVFLPLLICTGTVLCVGMVSSLEDMDWTITYWPLAIYGVAGFFFARRLFLDAEDVAPTGRQLFVGVAQRSWFDWLGLGFQKKRGPWSALICKELQMQQITIVLVALLVLLHLALLVACHFAPQWSASRVVRDSMVVIWMMAPWVIGSVAVAEERRSNTLEGNLCLPLRQRIQFAVKLAVALTLGTAVGGIVPWVLEHLGGAGNTFATLETLETLKNSVLAAAIVTAIAFFASTMSRGMLQAFAVAMSFTILWSVALDLNFNYFLRWLETPDLTPEYYLFLWPATILACLWRGYRNYRSAQTGWRLWAVNLAWLLAVFPIAWAATIANDLFRAHYFRFLPPRLIRIMVYCLHLLPRW
jgi:hypothetical protein